MDRVGMLRLHIENRFAILNAPLSMTVPSAASSRYFPQQTL